jgi:hypothetical protein
VRPRRRLAGLAALVALGALVAAPAHAGATNGALYPYGAAGWAVSPQFSGVTLPGPVWQIQAGPLNPAPAINHWEMNWGCPIGGSEIHAVQFSALRTQAASSMALQVTGNRVPLWIEGDAGIPQSPAAGRFYDIRLPGGHCNVHLALTQMEARAQHARGYFIDSPRILVRDYQVPSVALRAVTTGWINAAANRARVDWTAGDNFGSDGMGVHRIVVGGHVRWSGAPGAGEHAAEFTLDGVPDGIHDVHAVVDGDGTGAGSASGTLHLDRTPPVGADMAATPTAQPGGVGLAWRAADALSGVRTSQAEVNIAGDGSGSGAWEPVAGADGPGPHAAGVPRLGLADGVHAWRVRATDAAGNSGVTSAPDRVVVDTTPPKVELHAVPAAWVRRAEIDLTATDNLQATLGLGATEIDVNTAPDGGEGGQWIRRATAAAPPGRRIVPVDLAGLADGRHLVRVMVRNGGPLGAALATERRATVRVDHTDPEIARAGVTAGGPVTVSWVADDASAGVASVTVQWRDGATWRTIASQPARDGAGSLALDVSTLPGGERTFRLLVTDGAGNAAQRTLTARVSAAAAGGGTTADALARLRGARLALAVPGSRAQRRKGRTVLVRRIRAGARVTITGRLRDARGEAIVGAEVRAHGHRGEIVARGLTAAAGRVRMTGRPVAGGMLRIGVPTGEGLLPARATADVRIEVRPGVSLAASSASAGRGEQVVFSGRLRPAPRQIGLGSRKGVVLEWRDPLRRTWRPVVNARIRRDGTFAIPWSFNLRGLTIPMRVTVPTEVGWPLLRGRSGVIGVTVR